MNDFLNRISEDAYKELQEKLAKEMKAGDTLRQQSKNLHETIRLREDELKRAYEKDKLQHLRIQELTQANISLNKENIQLHKEHNALKKHLTAIVEILEGEI